MLTTFKGLKDFLVGKETLTKADDITQPGGSLPEVVVVTIHKCTNLYKPTVISNLKMDPYVAVYLTSKKAQRVKTPPKTWGGSNPTFDTELRLPFDGEPLVVVQAFAKELIADEFIGEVPLDLMAVLNSHSRSWTGPVTIYGQRGTATRGEVHMTLSFRGGTPYNPSNPALTYRQLAQLTGEDPHGTLKRRKVQQQGEVSNTYGMYQQNDPYSTAAGAGAIAASKWANKGQKKTPLQKACCCF